MEKISPEVFIDEMLETRIIPGKKLILYVGMKYDYGRKDWGLSYEHYAFYKTLLEMDYSLVYFDYQNINARFGAAQTTKLLKEAVFYYSPELLFYLHFHDIIDHNAWDELPVKKLIHLADDHWRYKDTGPVWGQFKNIITTDEVGYKKRQGRYNVIKCQWGANHLLYKSLGLPKKHDVSFVGRCYNGRAEFIGKLKSAGIDVLLIDSNTSRVTQAEMIRIHNQSKIGINISESSSGNKIQIKGRDFEIPACGTMLLTRDSAEIRKCFVPGKEIAVYKNVGDAVDKCVYYLKEEKKRERIAAAGLERVLRDHTYLAKMGEILNGRID